VAALPIDRREVVLLTTDALTEGCHFLPASPAEKIGAACVGVNLSDIAAKGGRPLAVLLDLLLPASTPVRWARAVVRGAEAFSRRFNCHIVGGDTKAAATRAVVGTAVGLSEPGSLAPRTHARPGDLVVTTGHVGGGGWAARPVLGLAPLDSRALVTMLSISPRVREGRVLGKLVHAMLDTSDGIAEAAHLLSEASRCRVLLQDSALPLDPRVVRDIQDPQLRRTLAFYGGDYELLASIAPSQVRTATRRLHRMGCLLTVVGRVTRGRGAWLIRGTKRELLPRAGWQPFAPRRTRKMSHL
jgi:thiamine-monophosphate kinase